MTSLIDLKERIAIGEPLSPQERNFVLDCINAAIAPKIEIEHSAPNYLGRIEALWAYLSLDAGGEGLCAAPFGSMTLPLIAADKQRLAQLRPRAEEIAKRFGKPVRLAKFASREDVEIIQP